MIFLFLYFFQTGLVLTTEQERQPVLKFVQEAVEKAAPNQEVKAGMPQLMVQDGEKLGRRKALAGEECC